MTSAADSSNSSSSLPENATPSGTAARAPAAATPQEVLWIHRWTPGLLSLRVTRDSRFRFTPGHYARLGLPDSSGPAVFRPLSITSAPAEAHLEFFCTLVTGGAFSSLLDRCRVGDPVQVEKASYGFLTLDALAPGHDLWLIASGSGLGPYLSILRDPEVWSAFARIVVVHSVRRAAELAYAEELEHLAQQRSATTAAARLHYLPVVTREPGVTALSQRIPALLADGSLATATGLSIDPEHSRVMVCGNPEMSRELRALLSERGFRTTRRGVLGQMAFEKYW
ncbi:MAG: ferredoxin--NADP reductase [Candidatus Accumulibacter meliphilus]|jgi:ferredoxin--NADP+ reductase|uniref:ferredoxin--NADP(+) reductase n=1 Tax=Candidatus Accumulibacter meliphilus TaxID=2211374 RepID=A0A369XKL0_9PROT|nr:MAG: ferredoxin--NADP reductase [Candidatus Accumulibacter meliphilus]